MSQPPVQESSSLSLPPPGEDALAHSRALADLLHREIAAAGGRISFARYMELALYAPGLGYYSAGAAKLGPEGDFVTAPEISPLFSRCLAGQVAQALEQLGGGDVMELGAGSGVMAADILEELERTGRLPDRYLILEVSADLRQRQQALLARRLPRLAERVQWLDQLPGSFQGVILGNEVMDALPVERVRLTEDGLVRMGVESAGEGFAWVEMPAGPSMAEDWERLSRDLPASPATGYTSELCLPLGPWLEALSGCLDRGLILLVDYGLSRAGYYHPERSDGTLICHYRHRAHGDPLIYPGIQDITAWVDFSRVAEAAVDSGLDIMGYTTQAHFLIAAGLEAAAARVAGGSAREQAVTAGQIRKLTLPGEMGERFKVIGLSRGLEQTISGFGLRDLTCTL